MKPNEHQKLSGGWPAFPVAVAEGTRVNNTGMSLRDLAAVQLKIPATGQPWLDELIEEGRRTDLAEELFLSGMNPGEAELKALELYPRRSNGGLS
jgi:hypothetical protein